MITHLLASSTVKLLSLCSPPWVHIPPVRYWFMVLLFCIIVVKEVNKNIRCLIVLRSMAGGDNEDHWVCAKVWPR